MPGSSTTPGRLGARVHAPIRVAFRIRNGVGTRDNNLCEAQWLACAFPYRRFAAVLTDDRARLGADVVSYSFTVSDLHRLLVAGLPAHIAVGTLIAECPPHRSERAPFRHSAPTSGECRQTARKAKDEGCGVSGGSRPPASLSVPKWSGPVGFAA